MLSRNGVTKRGTFIAYEQIMNLEEPYPSAFINGYKELRMTSVTTHEIDHYLDGQSASVSHTDHSENDFDCVMYSGGKVQTNPFTSSFKLLSNNPHFCYKHISVIKNR